MPQKARMTTSRPLCLRWRMLCKGLCLWWGVSLAANWTDKKNQPEFLTPKHRPPCNWWSWSISFRSWNVDHNYFSVFQLLFFCHADGLFFLPFAPPFFVDYERSVARELERCVKYVRDVCSTYMSRRCAVKKEKVVGEKVVCEIMGKNSMWTNSSRKKRKRSMRKNSTWMLCDRDRHTHKHTDRRLKGAQRVKSIKL